MSVHRYIALVALLVAGCAAGRVTAAGDVVGLAVGHARLESCRRGYGDEQLQMSVAGGERCASIEGGALSTGAAEFFTAVASAIGAWFGLM